MVEKLVGAARQAALHELHGWVEVEDRDRTRAAPIRLGSEPAYQSQPSTIVASPASPLKQPSTPSAAPPQALVAAAPRTRFAEALSLTWVMVTL